MLKETVLDKREIQPTNPERRPEAEHLGAPHLAFRRVDTLVAVLVLELQQQVHGGLAVLGLVQEASRVHLPFDGGVPVILHSIVRPAGTHKGPVSPGPMARLSLGTPLTSLGRAATSVNEGST